ncbi:LodA/GoxA family CTQ-dependent oxidase [Streptomyces noursei]|uniref:LodA/GoxA family CTQ-dependent oxidase n=1 Tax=Streptomyces noursei TaxID=1971 RepID=UPI00340C49B7
MDQQIVQAEIHPAIGRARVGNSDQPAFMGPESPDQPPLALGSYKDSSGKIIKQAARFRIYGYNKAGEVVREPKLGQDDVTGIRWSVHLANKKAAWYQFHFPLDIPEATDPDKLKPDMRRRRNAKVTGADRKKLVIDSGRQTIEVPRGQPCTLAGEIMGKQVTLGQAYAASDGRLLVAGGDGTSASWDEAHNPISGVANNVTWYDNVSDGPITAEVTIGGVTRTAGPAWVVVGPPHYAPGVKTIRTLYDLLYDVFVTEQTLEAKDPPSYPEDIEPLLARFCELQWVNHGFATQFGCGPHHFLDPAMRKRLNDPGETSRDLRRQIYHRMRDYDRDGVSPVPWPWIHGDGMSSGKATSVRQHLTLSPTQDRILAQWADGTFVPGPPRTGHPDVDQAPVAQQPGLLDRAALDNCAAEAFHPGSEVTWLIRHKTVFSEPFRILHRDEGTPEPDYGDEFTAAEMLGKNGPLHAQGPGDLTRWMAAPWRCDTASCRFGYQVRSNLGPRYSPYLPTFWPAQKFGIVEPHEYTVGYGKFPRYIQVESEPGYPPAPDHANLINIHVPEAGVPQRAAAAGTWRGALSAEAVESALVRQAIEEVKQLTGYDESAIAAGYLEKLDPFHENQ